MQVLSDSNTDFTNSDIDIIEKYKEFNVSG